MSVREKYEAGRYTNKVPYVLPLEPIDEETMTVRQAREHKEEQTKKQREQRDLHRAEDARLTALFKADLEKEFKLTKHPKADRLFALAWDHGHSSGYGEVMSYYEDFAELLQP